MGQRLRAWLRTMPAWAASWAVHLIVFALLLIIPYGGQPSIRAITVDTRLTDPVPPPEFARVLEADYDPDTDLTEGYGEPDGALSSEPGSDAESAAPDQLEPPPTIGIVPPDALGAYAALPSKERLDTDIAIRGEELSVVTGQGQAMDQITREILLRLRRRPVLVIWMFDESRSMFDERQDIQQRFAKVYQELTAHPETGNRALLSAIVGFGKDIHFLSPRPTDDVELLKKQVSQVPIDPSGEEWPCKHLIAVAQRYKSFARRGGRDVMVVLLTDESGQRSEDGLTPLDGALVEEAIEALREARISVYVIGRQAAFGFPFVSILYRDPSTGRTRWMRITRGPESPGVECLQTNGLAHSRPPVPSGFGPWELVRITRETGGVYFLIPAEEAGPQRDYQYDPFVMKNYLPDYGPRIQYVEAIRNSPLRRALVEVIRATADVGVPLNFSPRPDRFRPQAASAISAARTQRDRLRKAYTLLQRIAPSYAQESSLRWRAAFDLTVAQLFAYQIRLYQYEEMLKQLAAQPPVAKVTLQPGQSLYWSVRICTAREQSWVEEEELEPVAREALQLYTAVLERHAKTPWARVARIELAQGFSVKLVPVVTSPPTPGGRSEPVPEL